MKRIIALGLSSLLAIPIMSMTTVFAIGDSTSLPTETTTKPVLDTDKLKALTERVQQHKEQLKIKLPSVTKVRLQTKCKASQGNVSSISERIKGIETSRTQVYTQTTERLMALSTKLQNRGVDTASLDKAIVDLKTKIDTFNTDLATYKQSVSDLSQIDCTTDTEGFKALLEAARADQQKVREDGQAVRTQLKDVIRPILTTIRTQLESNSVTTKPEGNQ